MFSFVFLSSGSSTQWNQQSIGFDEDDPSSIFGYRHFSRTTIDTRSTFIYVPRELVDLSQFLFEEEYEHLSLQEEQVSSLRPS